MHEWNFPAPRQRAASMTSMTTRLDRIREGVELCSSGHGPLSRFTSYPCLHVLQHPESRATATTGASLLWARTSSSRLSPLLSPPTAPESPGRDASPAEGPVAQRSYGASGTAIGGGALPAAPARDQWLTASASAAPLLPRAVHAGLPSRRLPAGPSLAAPSMDKQQAQRQWASDPGGGVLTDVVLPAGSPAASPVATRRLAHSPTTDHAPEPPRADWHHVAPPHSGAAGSTHAELRSEQAPVPPRDRSSARPFGSFITGNFSSTLRASDSREVVQQQLVSRTPLNRLPSGLQLLHYCCQSCPQMACLERDIHVYAAEYRLSHRICRCL